MQPERKRVLLFQSGLYYRTGRYYNRRPSGEPICKPKPETPEPARKIYTDKRCIYLYQFPVNSRAIDTLKKNAVFYKGYYVVDRKNNTNQNCLKRQCNLNPGEVYNRTDHNQTINRLVNLGLFKFVKNRFETAHEDSPKLNTYYYLTPFPKKSIRAEVNANTKSNNLTGSSVTIRLAQPEHI